MGGRGRLVCYVFVLIIVIAVDIYLQLDSSLLVDLCGSTEANVENAGLSDARRPR